MLQHAFKEWAVICQALAEGKQALILRKGGIDETGGEFAVEQNRFWLFPTYTHQQRDGVRAEALSYLETSEHKRPTPGKVRLSHWCEFAGVYHVRDLTLALLLAHLHYWSDETIQKRFAYREPGLFVLVTRVYRATTETILDDTPHYQGCKSWVRLEKQLPTEGSTPVLSDKDFRDVQLQLDILLRPTALA
ncbi:MAG: DUF1802 family protein [Gemmataceae bacterium]|nr:DUF1802 family protein [Gemmataceae bacterium]